MKKTTIKIIAGTTAAALLTTTLSLDKALSKSVNVNDLTFPAGNAETNGLNIDEQEATLEKEITKINAKKSEDEKSKEDADKEETVYVTKDASGTTKSIIVSNWLKNTKNEKELTDASTLSEITNTKGSEEYTKGSNDSITWNADGKDIYYQGTSTKDIPVDMKVTYYLDGKEIAPDDLLGKSGKVTIHIDYTNKEKRTVTVDGKEETVYVPFTVVSGMMLPTDKFENITIDNGKVVSEGNNAIVIGCALPGLKESLEATDASDDIDLDIPESIEVTADCTDFELGMTMTYVTSSLLSEIDLDGIANLDDLEDSLDQLSDASKQLVEGSSELADGASKLDDASGQMNGGLKKLTDGLKAATGGIVALDAGAKQISQGANDLNKYMKQLVSGTTALENAVDGILKTGYEGDNGLVAGAKNLSNGVDQLYNGMAELPTGTQTLYDGLVSLQKNFKTVKAGTDSLISTVKSMSATLQSQLSSAASALPSGAASKYSISAMSSDNAVIEDINATYGESADQVIAGVFQYRALEKVASNLSGADVSQLDALSEGLTQMEKGIDQLVTGAKAVDAGVDSVYKNLATINSGAKALYKGAETLYEYTKQVKDAVSTLNSSAKQLQSGTESLASGAKQVAAGTKELSEGANQLVAGGEELSKGANLLTDGIGQLAAGSVTLRDGMITFDEEGIQTLMDTYEDVSVLFDKVEAIADTADTYQTYSGLADGKKGEVKFIIETEGITK